ncbi:glucose-1-phosphate cytidylyltransferase [Carboxydothermus pertinax]|uniref:Glucose-1-phosphate cytidylyltransferase n=1 Tax=Carboxydothermus pertinax TaxID=870242 RepID=A0A1L8CUM7_9THEO|nr:glucose-1-phosphate cytidylyltransferase [Carboxydothermus pertinax]GAV22602.1 glucose-1-phosphate cytidylyltransferase [Carboxydothermus pertinax]
MKVVILAGGFGTRISEESHLKPKPMIEIGGMPILWHIMKIYSYYGFNDFIICLGYKGYYIKEYFAHYYLHGSNVTFDFRYSNQMIIHDHKVEPWKVTLVDTGIDTMTGGRIKRIQPYIGNETFMLTYGDGVADVDINKLIQFHRKHKKIATVTAAQPSGRFGALNIENDEVISFIEKPQGDGGWVNAGFFVLEPEVFNYIEGDQTIWEKEPLETLAKNGQLMAYKHYGFWQPMDTMRDKNLLEELWKSGKAPWKLWE